MTNKEKFLRGDWFHFETPETDFLKGDYDLFYRYVASAIVSGGWLVVIDRNDEEMNLFVSVEYVGEKLFKIKIWLLGREIVFDVLFQGLQFRR